MGRRDVVYDVKKLKAFCQCPVACMRGSVSAVHGSSLQSSGPRWQIEAMKSSRMISDRRSAAPFTDNSLAQLSDICGAASASSFRVLSLHDPFK